VIPVILLLAFLQTNQADQRVPLREGCSADDPQLAVLTAADRVEVRGAIAGGDGTCYHVQVARGGETISGYVLGATLPAVAEFAVARDQAAARGLEAIAAQAALPAPAKNAAVAAQPPAPQFFENFSGRDLKGKLVSLDSLRGRLIVVQFWSPRGRSKQQLISLLPFYNQYRGRVSFLGVGMGVRSNALAAELDDVTLPFPQIADPGIARRYDVDPRAGKTFVLDSSHRVLASGSAADAMRAVREFLQ